MKIVRKANSSLIISLLVSQQSQVATYDYSTVRFNCTTVYMQLDGDFKLDFS